MTIFLIKEYYWHIGIILIRESSNDVQQAGTIMMNSIDHIIGYHCAPAIRGVKLSNLVSIPRDMNEQIQFVLTEYNKEFNEKDCSSLNYVAVKRVDYYWYSVRNNYETMYGNLQ